MDEQPQDSGPTCLVYGESSLLDALEESRGVYGSTIYPRSLFEVYTYKSYLRPSLSFHSLFLLHTLTLSQTMKHKRMSATSTGEGGADDSLSSYARSLLYHHSQSSSHQEEECRSFIEPPHPESTLYSALRAGSVTQLTAGRLHDASLQLTLPGKLSNEQRLREKGQTCSNHCSLILMLLSLQCISYITSDF